MRIVSLMGAVIQAMNGTVIVGVLAAILMRRNIGHRRFLWLIIIYTGCQACSATSVAVDLYRHTFTLITSFFRLATGVTGFACVVYLSIVTADLVRTLRDSECANRVRQDEADDRVMANTNILQISDHSKRVRSNHLEKLEKQATGG